MSKINHRLISILISIELTLCWTLVSADQSKVTSTTVSASNTPKGLLNVRSDFYPQGVFPRDEQYVRSNDTLTATSVQVNSDVTYSEPNEEERLKSKIDLVKKEKYQRYQHSAAQTDRQLNVYKRPSQFSNLVKNQPLIDKQKAAIGLSTGRLLTTNQLDKQTSEPNSSNDSPIDERNVKYESTSGQNYDLNQFTQSLNYLVKYLNRQGQTKLLNGSDHTKDANNVLLKHARNLDRKNCLLRLICEIGSNEEDASDNQLIKEIRVVFGNKHRAPAYPLKKDASFPFYYAGHVGATSGSAERCLEVFPVCSARTEELLQLVSNANKYSLNNAKLNRKADKIVHNSKLEKELYPTSESRSFSEKMRNKMKKLHKQYTNKLEH